MENIIVFDYDWEEQRIIDDRRAHRRMMDALARNRRRINDIDRTSSCVVECSMKDIMSAYDDWRESSLEP